MEEIQKYPIAIISLYKIDTVTSVLCGLSYSSEYIRPYSDGIRNNIFRRATVYDKETILSRTAVSRWTSIQ